MRTSVSKCMEGLALYDDLDWLPFAIEGLA